MKGNINIMIKLIAAVSKNNKIGLNGYMPWHLPEDLNYFKETTKGHTIIMGRKTYLSIGHALPNRRNIVLSRDSHFKAKDIEVIHSIEDALHLCHQLEDVFIIGGGEIYSAFMPYADELYLTLIDEVFDGDTLFPTYQHNFKCIQSVCAQTKTPTGNSFYFTIWSRL